MPRHPIILISLAVLFETFAVLLFPKCFFVLLALVIPGVMLFIFTGIKRHSKALLITVSAVFISAAVNPYISYIKNEKSAAEFILEYSEKDSVQYTATVTESSGNSFIYAKLLSADGITLTKQHKIRINSFSRESFTNGDIVTFTGKPVLFSHVEDEGFRTDIYLRSQSVFIDFPAASIISASYNENTSLFGFLTDYTESIISRYVCRGNDFDKAGLSFALFTGNKDKLSTDVKRVFSDCALTHIICVSGLHLFIVARIFFVILSLFSIPKKQKNIILIALCIFYTAFTGFSISTIRACIICTASFSGGIIGRKTDPFRSLFFSLLIIILFSPYSVFDAGAVLSFTATLGIICATKLLPTNQTHGFFGNIIHHLLSMAITGIGAVTFTLAVCAYYFGEISTVSVIATLCVSVFVEFALLLLIILMALSPLSFIPFFDGILDIIGEICYHICSVIIDIAEYFASFSFSVIPPLSETVLLIIFIITLFFTALTAAFGCIKGTKILTCFTVIASLVFLFLSLHFAVYNDGFYRIHYYRKNESDRQLSVKLGHDGYLIINADSNLATKVTDIPFDYKKGNNHLLLLPDKAVSPHDLTTSIKVFDEKFGIKSISVPDTVEGRMLADALSDNGITCGIFIGKAELSDITVELECDDGYYLTVDGEDMKTAILFSDNYDETRFDKTCDICAFFTRKTKNQFNLAEDIAPECDVFITRLKKGQEKDGFINTFGEKRVIIKE